MFVTANTRLKKFAQFSYFFDNRGNGLEILLYHALLDSRLEYSVVMLGDFHSREQIWENSTEQMRVLERKKFRK